ncbi:MAG: RsmB/NOP family class I SAM-dependent RNA methyltransferase [Promethearchaeota archaeon]
MTTLPVSQICDQIRKMEETSGFDTQIHTNSLLFHYIQEIQRYKTTIRFIFQKTVRSFQKKADIAQFARDRWEIFYFAIYRFTYEDIAIQQILHNFKQEVRNTPKYQLVSKFLHRVAHFDWKLALKGKDSLEQLSIQHALPSFFIRTLLKVQSQAQIEAQGKAMDVSPRKGTVSFWIVPPENTNHIQDFGLSPMKDLHIPNLFHLPVNQKAKLIKSRLFQQGTLIIQDKASVTAAFVLDPSPYDFILDMCAAPGMKTSYLATMSTKPLTIIANDFHPIRIRTMHRLFQTLPLPYSHPNLLNADGYTPPLRSDPSDSPILFDRILLDAPCTGSGTFAAHPELKKQQSPGFLRHHISLQKKLLQAAIDLLKPEGILVYSTCSLYPQEGEFHFQNTDLPLKPCSLPSWISPPYKTQGDNGEKSGMGRFYPGDQNGMGFFIAKFQKTTEN